MAKKSNSQPSIKDQDITAKEPVVNILETLDLRNEEVERVYHNIIKGVKQLLTPFESLRYRMNVVIDHTRSGKQTNLINEYLCFFHNITLGCNRFGYWMIYVSYDEHSLKKFGNMVFNRMLRIVFTCTNPVINKINVQNCVRIDHSATDIQPFFINRLLAEPKDYIIITAEELISN